MTSISLRSYLDTRRGTKTDHNVTGMPGGQVNWGGKYKIPANEYPAFLELLHEHVFVKGKACSLVEQHKSQSPILIDLDLCYAAGGPLRRRFGEPQMREFVAAYADAFARFLEPPAEPLQFFVSVKPAPEMDDKHSTHKDGIHVVCPTVSTTPDIQYAIRGYLIQKGVIERIFGPTGNLKPEEECFDKSVIQHSNWFLYGACKPDRAWYKVEYVYSVTVPTDYAEITPADLIDEPLDQWSPLDLINLLSLQHGHDEPTALVPRSSDGEWAQLMQRWGKGDSWAKVRTPALQTATAADPPALSLDDNMIQLSGVSARSDPNNEEIKLAYKLVTDCLNPTKRAGEYHNWIRLGLLLHNIAANDKSYQVWVTISRKVPGFASEPESTYKTKWLALPTEAAAVQRGVKPLTIATIHHYAKEDSYTAYRDIMDNSYTQFAIHNYSGTHVSVADLVFNMYQHEFRCTPLNKKGGMDWYQYAGNTWKNLKSAMKIRELLSNDVRRKYMKAGSQLRNDHNSSTATQEDCERINDKLKKLNKLESALQTSGFKDSVMKELTEKFYNEDFLQYMNQNPALVGFANGVLDLRHIGADGQYHVHFRPGQPDDCISFQMGRGIVGLDAFPFLEGSMAYQPGTTQPEYAEIMDFFTKIYPDPVLREYALTLFAACLEGANREQKFYIMTGVGSNGKSKIVELMTKTFGEYQETIGTTALTRKRPDSGAANPDLVTLKCKRFVSMSEPDEGEKINTASMKQLSGEDIVKARALFQDQDQFVIMARIFMLCNDLPPVSSTDGGTWRRLRVIPHVAKFVDNDKPTDPTNHVYHKDLTLDSKIARWRPYFASMLVWYYENRYLRSGLKEPDKVSAASNKYKEENDVFAAFCQECMVREVGAEVQANDIMVRYKEWMRYNPGKKVMTKVAVLAKMSDVYGAPVDPAGKIYAGVRIADEAA